MPLALLVLAGFESGSAQRVPSPYRFVEPRHEAGGFVGYMSMDRGTYDLGPKPGLLVGGRYTFRVSGAFAVEGTLWYFPSEVDVIDPRRLPGQRDIGDASLGVLGLDGRLRFTLTGDRTWNGLAPHLMAGAGFAADVGSETLENDDRLQEQKFDFGTPLVALLGAGLRYLPDDRFLIRGDVTMRLWKLDVPPGFRDADPEAPDDEWVSGFAFTLGASLLF